MAHMVAENRGEHCLVREQASKGLVAQHGGERVVGRREEGETVRVLEPSYGSAFRTPSSLVRLFAASALLRFPGTSRTASTTLI
jgi:hypothetical protein